MSFVGPSLRDRLRSGTRPAQDAMDRVQKLFDLSTPDGFLSFLRAQRDALAALHPSASALTETLATARTRIRDDLADLGCTEAAIRHQRPKTSDPLGLAYVWHAQQLGLRLLSRQLPEGTGTARRFMTAPRDVAAWRALCEQIENLPGYGPKADAALHTANDWLALFETIHLTHARGGT